MMRAATKNAILMLALSLTAGTVFAQNAAHGQLVRQDIAGVVLHPDGQTPVEDLAVQVWDASRERVIFKTQTDENGNFLIPAMRTGPANIYVGRVKIDVDIVPKGENAISQQHSLVVVLNRFQVHSQLMGISPIVIYPILEPLLEPPPEVVSP